MADHNPLFLSPLQRRIVAAGGTALAAALLLAFLYGLFLLLRMFVGTFQDVFLPLVLAAILATLLRPTVQFCERTLRLSRLQGIVLLYVLVILSIGVLAAWFVPIVITQVGEFVREFPELKRNVLSFLQSSAPGLWEWLGEQLGKPPDEYINGMLADPSDRIEEALGKIQSSLGTIGGFFGGVAGKVAAYSIIPVYLFFLLKGNPDVWGGLQKQLDFLPADRRRDLVFLARQFSDILIAFFRGQIIIGLLLGVVLAAGFALVGLKFGIVLGLVLGLLNIIPYLGTMMGIVTVLPLAYFQEGGGLPLVGFCAGVFILGQLLTDYVFTPRVMGDKTGMSPMLIIFSVFFWGTALDGILGMVLAIPLTAFFLIFWRLVRQKYLPAPDS